MKTDGAGGVGILNEYLESEIFTTPAYLRIPKYILNINPFIQLRFFSPAFRKARSTRIYLIIDPAQPAALSFKEAEIVIG